MSVRGESPEEERRSSTRGRIFPLNSGRLTATIVTRIAKGLHLPQSASLEETRQMIEGELLSEREPRNVQVIIEEAAPGVTISLRDESGVFLEIAPDEPGDGGKSGEASEAEEGEGSVHGGAHEEDPRSREHLAERRLRNSVLEGQESDGESRALELEQEVAELVQEKNQLMGENTELAGKNVELSEQTAALTEEVIKLRGSLGEEKEKNRAEWRRNCQLLIEYDDLLTAKDQEIADLKSRLERLTAEHGGGKGKELETSGEEATPLAPITPSRLTAGGGSHVSSREPFRRRPGEELGGACISDEHVRVDKGSICSNITAGGTTHPSRVRATTRTRRPPGIAKEDEGSPSIDVIARGTSDGWTTPPRRGKAPPVDPFSGEVPDSIFDDWLPALQRAAAWNGWSDKEKLLQLAGHLWGRALQEWNLLRDVERETFEGAVDSLRTRIDPGSRTLAAQDFRYTIQREQESVSEFIRRLEQTFRLAYGKERMSTETRDMLLHGQLQEGLRYDLMKAPAVSGSHGYKELCLASRNEEKRLAELAMRRQYLKQPQQLTTGKTDFVDQSLRSPTSQPKPQGQFSRRSEGDKNSRQRLCYNCNKPGHLAWECREERTESAGRGPNQRGRQVDTKQVCTSRRGAPGWVQQSSTTSDLLSNLLSSDSASDDAEEGVRQIRVHDQGSKQQFAEVQIEGVPAKGVIDSGAEITIIGGKLFARIAAVARLKKSQLKAPDRIPKTYDRRSFTLDGRMDLDVSFGGMSMQTPVYIKVDAPEQLLLAEGVCRQLNIITYHPSVTSKRSRTGGDNRPKSKKMKSNGGGSECSEDMDTTTKTAMTADPGVGNQPTGQQGASTACRRGEKPTLVDGATLPTDVNKDTEGQTTRASRAAQSGVRPRKRASSWSGTAPRAEVKRPQCIEWSSRILPSDTRNRERNKEECGGNAVVPDVTKTAISATRTATHRAEGDASVPMVLVRLITSLRVLPHQSVLARVRIDTKYANSEPLLLQWEEDVEDSLGVSMGDALICPNQESAKKGVEGT